MSLSDVLSLAAALSVAGRSAVRRLRRLALALLTHTLRLTVFTAAAACSVLAVEPDHRSSGTHRFRRSSDVGGPVASFPGPCHRVLAWLGGAAPGRRFAADRPSGIRPQGRRCHLPVRCPRTSCVGSVVCRPASAGKATEPPQRNALTPKAMSPPVWRSIRAVLNDVTIGHP